MQEAAPVGLNPDTCAAGTMASTAHNGHHGMLGAQALLHAQPLQHA